MAGIAVLLYLVLILMSGGLARRVLGVPIGWPRVIVVGFVVLASAYGVVYGVLTSSGLRLDPDSAQEDPLPYVVLPILAMAWTFLGGLVLLVLLEIFLPTGTLPPVRALFTGWRARLRRARRYAQISAIAARHGLGAYLRGRRRTAPVQGMAKTARSLTAALNEAGVAFIKFGQMLSSRPDLVPDVFVRELSRLQTGAAPEPWPRIEAAIEEALGRPIGEVFASVDPEPLAAASVAQVHAGELLGGERVVVKVQRPGAQRQVEADVDILLRLGRRLDRGTAWGAALGVRRLAEGFADSLEEELDYTVEMDNMRAIAGAGGIRVPAPYPEHSSRTLLVMERIDGVPVGDAAGLLAGFTAAERREIAERLVGEVLRQITVTGVFHADLHMGNILIGPDRELAMLDFGSVGRLDSGARTSLGLLLMAIERDDSIAASDALIDLLDRPDELDERRLEREVGQVMVRFAGGLGGRGAPTCSPGCCRSSSGTASRCRRRSPRPSAPWPHWRAPWPRSAPTSTWSRPPAGRGGCSPTRPSAGPTCGPPWSGGSPRCCPPCSGCPAGSTRSPRTWSRAGSPSPSARSPTAGTEASSPAWSARPSSPCWPPPRSSARSS
ncbi:AarF/UbiB family protein [Nocardiopsis composta]